MAMQELSGNTESDLSENKTSIRREGDWAAVRERIEVGEIPAGVTPINVQGRLTAGALQGFGQLWKKTYQIRLRGITSDAVEVMDIWKKKFSELQPPGNKFYLPIDGLEAGDVIFIDSPLPVVPPMYDKPGLVPMTSGVMVMYNDSESFAVMTPEGFPVAGWNNFSVFEDNGELVAQVQSFERASDPIYEFGFRFMAGAKRQEFIWKHVLTRLAETVGVKGEVSIERECLDPRLQWAYAAKVWQNAGVRTTFYKLATPFRWLGARLRK